MSTYTVIASSITLPGSMNIWTFDSRAKVGTFIQNREYARYHWDVIHLSVYESTTNSGEAAILSLQSIEDFYAARKL